MARTSLMSKAIQNLREKRDDAEKQVEILNLAIAQLEAQVKPAKGTSE